MTTKLYYTPPEDRIFEDLRTHAMELWKEVDSDGDKYGYSSGKIARIKDIHNIEDNFMYMVAMFDYPNQCKLAERLHADTKEEIRKRMIDGGQPLQYIPF